MRPDRASFRRRILLIASAAVAARLLLGGLSWRTLSGLVEDERRLGRSQERLLALERARSGLWNADTAETAFLAQGRPDDAAAFRKAARETRQALASLWDLSSRNAQRQTRVGKIIELAQTRFDLGESAIKSRRRDPREREALRAALDLVNAAQDEETSLVVSRTTQAGKDASWALSAVVFAAFGSLLLIAAVAAWLLWEFDRFSRA